jgi:hypothetical protein
MYEAMKVYMMQINSNLMEATRVAPKQAGISEGIEISMDIEQLLYDANRLHDAICLMNRIA